MAGSNTATNGGTQPKLVFLENRKDRCFLSGTILTNDSRSEALYLPAADMFKMAQPLDAPEEVAAAALKTMSTAFRMAERDMKAALTNPSSKTSGPYRNAFGARIHCRLSKKDLAELNRHLRAIEKMMTRAVGTGAGASAPLDSLRIESDNRHYVNLR